MTVEDPSERAPNAGPSTGLGGGATVLFVRLATEAKERTLRVWSWWVARNRAILPLVFAETAPLDLRIVGRMLLHAAAVGIVAGLVGAAFFAALEFVQRSALEGWTGYVPLRAFGEMLADEPEHTTPFRPWLLLFLPAIGGLLSGLITRFAPEARGGGGDAMIRAFHQSAGIIRPRVIWAKGLASVATLGLGGSGGREGPTMLIGAAIGSGVSRLLKTSARERRVLLVAGVAAGISAVFRTPLGAALLAVEVLYRDGFESDALIPSVFSSVIAYSVVISIFGESTLFAHAARYPFVPAHLPLYGLLALGVAALAITFVATLHAVEGWFAKLQVPEYLKPALGGLGLGLLATPAVIFVGDIVGVAGQGLGIIGGGYGAAQLAITGGDWLPVAWRSVQLLLFLAVVKLLASSLTIGSGGSAGDFAPSLVLGGLFGGAFGRAAALLLEDPRIDPGAFALVGMGAFYGGIAHVPLSALVLVCELAGSYDLLVPLMLAEGIAFVALRKRALYRAQVPTQKDSPAHRDALLVEVLSSMRVKELMTSGRPYITFAPESPLDTVVDALRLSTWQDVFPVLDESGGLVGILTHEAIRRLGADKPGAARCVKEVMMPPIVVRPEDDLRRATEVIIAHGQREILVVDDAKRIVGFLDEAEIARVYLSAAERVAATQTLPPIPPVPPVPRG